MIASRCIHTGEIILLSPSESMFVPRGPGEMARASTLVAGELAVQANGREVRILAAQRTVAQHEAQHGLADLELGLAG